MNISELKKIVQKLGGLLVMDGDDPSFVVLSYRDYKQLIEGDGDYVAVHKDQQLDSVGLADYQQFTGNELNTHEVPQEGFLTNGIEGDYEPYSESEEDKINRLNQEIALLKNEIKQREIELFVDGLE